MQTKKIVKTTTQSMTKDGLAGEEETKYTYTFVLPGTREKQVVTTTAPLPFDVADAATPEDIAAAIRRSESIQVGN